MNKKKELKSSKTIFYYVCGIGVLCCILAYLIPFRIIVNKASELDAENTVLETELVTWREYYANMDTYLADTEEIKNSLNADLEEYPSDVLEEDVVMLAVDLQEATEAVITNINIADKEEVYTIDAEKTLATGIEDFTDTLVFSKLAASYVIDCDYDSIKECVGYIYKESNKKGISSITISKNDDGSLAGSIDADFYYLEGTTRKYVKPSIPTYIKGTENIFGITSIVEDVQSDNTTNSETEIE